MAEFASAILSFIVAGLAAWRRIDQVVNSIKNASEDVEHWREMGGVLTESLCLMETSIRARQGNLTRPEQNLCKAIDKSTRDFMDDLQTLEGTIPTRRGGKKYWVPLKKKLQEDCQLQKRLIRNVQIFQTSAFGLSLLDPPPASASGPGPSPTVTRVQQLLEDISDNNSEQLDQENQLDLNKWREALYEVADVAAQREFPDAPSNRSPPVTSNAHIPSSDEAPRWPSGVSAKELKDRFDGAVSLAKHLYEAGLPTLAKKAHDKAIQYREEMQSIDENAIGAVDLVNMEISYVRIIKACVPYTKSYEPLAQERLKKLKDSLEQSQPGVDINPEFCNEQEKVGVLCADLGDHEGAIHFLRKSLRTYLSDRNAFADKIQRISMLVCEQYERLGQRVELGAFKKSLIEELLYDPTLERNVLTKTIDWCHQHGFPAAEREGHLDIPKGYLVNSTILHEAAADMAIQPEVIHQLMLKVYHAKPDTNGDTPLLVAVQHSNNTALQALLRIIGLVHVRDAKGRTPLHRCNNEKTLKLLPEEIKKPVHHSRSADPGLRLVHIDSTDAYGTTALHEACDKGNEGMVRLLIDGGADINLVSGLNETPLMLTCVPYGYKGTGKLNGDRQRILEMLVSRDADTRHKDDRGKPAVPKSLKIRGYSKAEIKRMLSPDPGRIFVRNRGHGRNSDSTVSGSERPSSVVLRATPSSSPVELMGVIPTRPYELDTLESIPRFTPPHSSPDIPAHHTRSSLQLAELQGAMLSATAVEENCGTVSGTAEPSNQRFLVGEMKSIRRKMRVLGG